MLFIACINVSDRIFCSNAIITTKCISLCLNGGDDGIVTVWMVGDNVVGGLMMVMIICGVGDNGFRN